MLRTSPRGVLPERCESQEIIPIAQAYQDALRAIAQQYRIDDWWLLDSLSQPVCETALVWNQLLSAFGLRDSEPMSGEFSGLPAEPACVGEDEQLEFLADLEFRTRNGEPITRAELGQLWVIGASLVITPPPKPSWWVGCWPHDFDANVSNSAWLLERVELELQVLRGEPLRCHSGGVVAQGPRVPIDLASAFSTALSIYRALERLKIDAPMPTGVTTSNWNDTLKFPHKVEAEQYFVHLRQCLLERIHPTVTNEMPQHQPAPPLEGALSHVEGNQPDANHSLDFRSVHWFGTDYTFSPTQAACVCVLWKAWKAQTPELGGQTILEEAEANNSRLDMVFRDSPAWGTMIVHGSTKGAYRLNPESVGDSSHARSRK